MKINKKDITIVLQGSCLDEYSGRLCVELAVESIRKKLPECKIILSTWESEKEYIPNNIQVDKIIYNSDPGFKTRNCKPDGKPNNVNRQIVSSINGLKEAETTYAMKMRTDYVMKNTGFLQHFDIYKDFDKKYQIFDKRIICVTPGTRKPKAKNYNLPFHIADHNFLPARPDGPAPSPIYISHAPGDASLSGASSAVFPPLPQTSDSRLSWQKPSGIPPSR